MGLSNFPPGVTGNEPEITGEDGPCANGCEAEAYMDDVCTDCYAQKMLVEYEAERARCRNGDGRPADYNGQCFECESEDEEMRSCSKCGNSDTTYVQTSSMTGEASWRCRECGNVWF